MKKFQVLIGEKTYAFEQEDQTLTLNGEALSHAFQGVGNGLYSLVLRNQSYPVFVQEQPDGHLRVTIKGRSKNVTIKTEKDLMLEKFGVSKGKGKSVKEVNAPMPGLVLRIYVEPGQTVKAGERLLVLEAMKMENELKSPAAGTVKAIHVQPTDAVGKGALLISFE